VQRRRQIGGWLNGVWNMVFTGVVGAQAERLGGHLNQALSQGLNLLFTPGVYHVNQTINVTRPDTVVLGLGFPTLIPDNGVTPMTVADVNGVKLAGLLFAAGPVTSPVLVQVGPSGSSASHARDPTSIQDVFFRIGGAGAGSATTSLVVNSSNAIIDDIWAWRADHGYFNVDPSIHAGRGFEVPDTAAASGTATAPADLVSYP